MAKKFNDIRGTLMFPFKNNDIISDIHQCTVSHNKKNVFRGFHCNNFDKLVTCIKGKVLDIIINLDENHEEYLIAKYYELDSMSDNNQVLVPRNYAHGFLSLENDTILLYHFNGSFDQATTRTIHYLDPYINIKLPTNNIVISEKDNNAGFIKPVDYILLGSTGYIGSNIYNTLIKQNKNVITIADRLCDIVTIKNKLLLYKPKYVINAAGLTGVPNISWCETNKIPTIETNITYQLTLTKICNDLKIHLTIIGSGGIFKGDGIKSEQDSGNFIDTFYSECRIYLENLIKYYPNCLYLRVNYPLSSDNNFKNLIVKLSKWNKIVDSSLSVTCLDSLIPLLSKIVESNEVGILNFVNPGIINLVDIKRKYNKINNITDKFEIIENSDKSIPILDTSLIEKYNPENINTSLDKCIYKLGELN